VDCHHRCADISGQFSENGVGIVGSRTGFRRDPSDLAVDGSAIDPEARVDFVNDVPCVGVAGEFAGAVRPGVDGVEVPDIAQR